MVLVHYRDAGMHTYTWFYKNDQGYIVSPYFDTEQEAKTWFEQVFDQVQE